MFKTSLDRELCAIACLQPAPKPGPSMAKTTIQDRKKPGKPHAFIDSALRTLDAGAGGGRRSARPCRANWGTPLCCGGRPHPRRQGPGDRHRHGQVGPRRPQDRGNVGLDRHAGLLRASGRSEPRRSRHDHDRRRHHGAVLVGRDRRAQGPDRLLAALPHRAHRGDRASIEHARQVRRGGAGAARGARGLPAQSGADHVVADAACARRRTRSCACWRAAASPRSISACCIRVAGSAHCSSLPAT